MLLSVAKRLRGTALCAFNAPDWLARHYGGTDKFTHGYLRYYRHELSHLRWRRSLIYEIGVGGYGYDAPGGSLQLWRDYFQRSVIVGLDLHQKQIDFGPRVRFEQADQSSAADLHQVVARHGPPSVVIDDGSHVGEHIQASFDVLWPIMSAPGVYVIEDLSTSFDPSFGGSDPPPPSSAIALLQTLISDTQAVDPVFSQNHRWVGPQPRSRYPDVACVRIYPGIAFAHKRSSQNGLSSLRADGSDVAGDRD